MVGVRVESVDGFAFFLLASTPSGHPPAPTSAKLDPARQPFLDPQTCELDLSRQLCHPMRWPAALRRACEPGGNRETSPGTSQAWRKTLLWPQGRKTRQCELGPARSRLAGPRPPQPFTDLVCKSASLMAAMLFSHLENLKNQYLEKKNIMIRILLKS